MRWRQRPRSSPRFTPSAASLPSGSRRCRGIGHANLNVGLIAGGINTNVVPDKVTFRIDRRMIPEENPQAVEQELRDLIAQATHALPGLTTDVTQILVVRPMAVVPGQERLVAALTEAAGRRAGRGHHGRRHADLLRRPALFRARNPDGAVRGRTAHDAGSEWPPRRREPGARRSENWPRRWSPWLWRGCWLFEVFEVFLRRRRQRLFGPPAMTR